MKAAVLESPGKLVYKEVEKPQPGPGQALLNVKAASICGSDILRVFHGEARTYPLILGHECAGIITAAGPDVDPDLIGRRAILIPHVPCLECPACRRHIYAACQNYSFIGSRQNGGFAEYVAAPRQNLLPIPDTIDFEIGAILEPATVAAHILERSGVAAAQKIAILGAGSVGLCLVQWARIKGAEQIITTDIIEENLQTAQSLGSQTVLNPKQDDIVERILELTEDGVDLAIEAVGLPQTLEQAIAITRPRGVVMCVGFLPAEATLPAKLIDRIIRYELTIRGSQMSYSHPFPGHEWTDTIEAALSGQLEMRAMISHRFPLSAAPEVLNQMETHTLEYRKIILRP